MTEVRFDLAMAMKNGSKCRTRDGRDARIICTNCRGLFPIVALLSYNEKELVKMYRQDGKLFYETGTDEDLFNIPTKKTVFINFYEDLDSTIKSDCYTTKEKADTCKRNRIAFKEITFDVGGDQSILEEDK